jgi:large subunit ribosomal protein LP0
MGKNTMMKRSIRLYCEQTGDDKWAPLIDQLVSSAAAPLRPCAP